MTTAHVKETGIEKENGTGIAPEIVTDQLETETVIETVTETETGSATGAVGIFRNVCVLCPSGISLLGL